MVSRVSSGFRDDCFQFLSDFAKLGSPEYHKFCQEWRRTNFQYIFCGRSTAVELVEYTNEIFYIVKQYFFCSQLPLERIGAFYLLYTLYFKQPMHQFCKIRLTLPDWRTMKEFVSKPYNDKELPEMSIILWKLFKSDAFQFVQEELECGFDTFFLKSLNNRHDYKVQESFKPNRHLEKELHTMHGTDGIIKALEILEMGYNEMKETLDDCESSSPDAIVGDKIPQSTLMEGLRKDVESLLSVMGTSAVQPVCSEPERTLTKEHAEQPDIGTKRYSLRTDAYKRVIKQRRLQIAGQETQVLPEPSSGVKDSSPVAEKKSSTKQSENKEETKGYRTFRRRKTCISDDDVDDDDVDDQ